MEMRIFDKEKLSFSDNIISIMCKKIRNVKCCVMLRSDIQKAENRDPLIVINCVHVRCIFFSSCCIFCTIEIIMYRNFN